MSKPIALTTPATDARVTRGLCRRKFEATVEGGVWMRTPAGNYSRLGTLPVNNEETRAEVLRRLRTARPATGPAKGAGPGTARKIFAAYQAELEVGDEQ